jgi:virginiamycin B lyase
VFKNAWSAYFPEHFHGISVAIGPDGVPWFGLLSQAQAPSLAHLQQGKLMIEALREEENYGITTALQFDPQGSLWFAVESEGSDAIARRDPDGTVKEFPLPQGGPVSALTFGPEEDIWFVRGSYGETADAEVGRMTTAGAVTQFPLEAGSHPTSITLGPDGALWFSEEQAGKIGRITTSGEVRRFALALKVEPRQIVVGAEGSLWFGENGLARRYGRVSDRIGRITTDGQVSELPVPFGKGTSRLASDPRGVIWFATDEGEFSSISPSGNVGARGCVKSCGDPIEALSLAPNGVLWFAAGHAACLMCGGGSDLIIDNEGTEVGQVPSGALAPANPNGPPAVDPYAHQTDHPPPPIARTLKPREVEGDFAELTGYINSRGFPTTWLFRWGKAKKYGHKTFLPEFPFGAEEGAARISEEIFGFCPDTTYHYEIVAYGPGGRTSGGDRAFKTKPEKHQPRHCSGT